MMKIQRRYFIIPATLAESIGVTGYRIGNNTDGYLVTLSDLTVIGIDAAIAAGAREITAGEAADFVKNHKKK